MNAINLHEGTLCYSQRPLEVQQKIDTCFEELANQQRSDWYYNGEDNKYEICDINEHRWVVAFIKKNCSEKKDFYVMDIGAGKFCLGKAIADTINQQILEGNLPKDISVTILNLRGEQNPNEESIQSGNCHLLNLGAFKIENILEEFKKRNISIENKVDLILSRWTFIHFVDPVGTFAQTLQLLRPETGLLLMDRFNYLYENQTFDNTFTLEDTDRNLIHLLLNTNVQFVMKFDRTGSQFALKKETSDCIYIPLEYKTLQHDPLRSIANYATQFKGDYLKNNRVNLPQAQAKEALYGHKDLFNELASYSARPSVLYRSIQRRESLEENSLFKAIKDDDDALLTECFENDIGLDFVTNYHSEEGFTPLSLSIQLDRQKLFDLILHNDLIASARKNLDGKTPFHIAVIYDKQGYFLEKLIQQWIDRNGKMHESLNKEKQTFYDLAKQHNNQVAMDLIQKHFPEAGLK